MPLFFCCPHATAPVTAPAITVSPSTCVHRDAPSKRFATTTPLLLPSVPEDTVITAADTVFVTFRRAGGDYPKHRASDAEPNRRRSTEIRGASPGAAELVR